MGKESVAVRIAGHEYKIRSDGDAASLREIASYVDRAMARVRERTGTVDSLDVAVLTCLNLAREILALHGQQTPSGAVAIDEEQLRGLIQRVESSIGRDRPGGSARNDSEDRQGSRTVAEATPRSDDGAAKTLDLPSVEALRERTSPRTSPKPLAGGGVEPSGAAREPEARVAAGGRDRAS